MIGRVVAWSVEHRHVVVLTTLALAAIGVGVGSRLEFDALPDTTNNQVLVLTRAPGLTPEEVERLVSRPIEAALGGTPGLEEERSISRYGISSVTVVFQDEIDIYRARQIVKEHLDALAGSFPPGVSAPELGPVTGGLGEIFHFTISSPRRTAAELLEIATLRLAPQLRAVPGVVEVNTWGGQQRTLEVRADPVRMAQRGLTLSDLRDALRDATGTAAGASLPAGSAQALLRAVALPRDASDLGHALVFRRGDVNPVRLAEVANLSEGELPRIGAATANGSGETVYLMAQMLRGGNALDVMRRVHARMNAVQRLLPDDVHVEIVYDRSHLVNATLHTVFKNLLEGGLLVVGVLFLMLGSLRAGLLVASAIPLSMLGATAAMVALGVPGNLMSLGALDFGLLVDGAVVMVESVFHGLVPSALLALGAVAARDKLRAHVGEVTRSAGQPVFFSVLIILLVYVPVLSLTGVDGKMFRPMALTVVFALTTALILTLTFIPAAASLVLRPKDVPERPPLLVRAIHRAYEPFLAMTVRRPRAVAVGAVALTSLAVFMFVRAGSEFVPQLDEGDLVVQTTRAADISLDSAVREAGRLEQAVLRVPEVKQVVSRIGSPAVATDIMGLEQADVFVALKPREAWRPGLTRDALVDEVERAIAERAPGGDPSFTQPIQMRFNELLGGSVADVTVSVYGDDLGELRRIAEHVASVAGKQRGAEDTRVIAPPSVALLEARPRPLDASSAGFTVREVLDAVQAVRTGIEVGATYDGPLRIPIVLRLGESPSAFTLADLAIPAPSGGLVPLGRVADVLRQDAPSVVLRHDGERRLVVGFNVRGADLGSVVAGAEKAVAAAVQLPRGYRLEWGGQYQTLAHAKRRLAVVIPAVLVLIVGVLLLAFRRVRPALVIFMNVPFASVGGMIALGLRGMPVSISSAVGFIALSGVAVLNGVVLMARLIRLEEEGHPPAEAAVMAARERARPVLMTALVAALGFLPMALATGVGAEVQRPLATVVCGGLVTSTVLTLLVLPTLYPWVAGRRARAPGGERLAA